MIRVSSQNLEYRPEIDGLRALAVVGVIFFHAHIPIFAGGYAGVDVFFVISGYLITAILTRELQNGNFNLAQFYLRRARRILPALFLVVTVTCLFALIWMPPNKLASFGASVTSVGFFASNIFFAGQGDYFDTSADIKPLLHTWSLAVEEQFYLLFPLFLFLIWRYAKEKLFLGLCLVALSSFLLSAWLSFIDPVLDFYLPFTRFWELVAGAICSQLALKTNAKQDNILSGLGVIIILGTEFFVGEKFNFGNLGTLAAVLGTCFVLLFGSAETYVGRGLAWKPVVAIGILSYSLYLWHQPIFSLAHYRLLVPPNFLITSALLGLTAICAVISWRLVENPMRRAGSPKPFIVAMASASFILVAFGISSSGTEGFPNRFSPKILTITDGAYDVGKYRHNCLSMPMLDEKNLRELCHLGVKRDKVDFLLIGDSIATALGDGFDAAATDANQSGLLLTVPGCAPLLGVGTFWYTAASACKQLEEELLQASDRWRPDFVVLAARWPMLNDPQNYPIFRGDTEQGMSAFRRPLLETVNEFNKRKIRVFIACCTPISDYGSVPETYFKLNYFGIHKDIRPTREDIMQANHTLLRLLDDSAIRPLVSWLDLMPAYCGKDFCELIANGMPVLNDEVHLSKTGSLSLAPAIAGAFVKPTTYSDGNVLIGAAH